MTACALAALLAGALALGGWVDAAGAKKKHRSSGPPAPKSCTNANTAMHSLSLGQIDVAIACLINKERASRGLATLRVQSQLRSAARAHNADMQQRLHRYTHDSSNGDSFAKRIGRSGYMKKAKRWAIGEVLDQAAQASYTTPTDALYAWLQSSSHNRILHVAKFRDFGVATARGTAENPSADGALITVDFGYRKK